MSDQDSSCHERNINQWQCCVLSHVWLAASGLYNATLLCQSYNINESLKLHFQCNARDFYISVPNEIMTDNCFC